MDANDEEHFEQMRASQVLLVASEQTNEQSAMKEEPSKAAVSAHSQRVAEMSVVAFVKVLGHLAESPVLATYRGHPGLQFRLGKKCRVHLGYGLHSGWAIEGAVGSEFKIDASYLSPTVSIAGHVERATQFYGVSLLVAQSVMDMCDKSLVEKCRLIDRCVITGSVEPMELYCVDLDYHSVKVSTKNTLGIIWNPRNRYKARQFLEAEKNAKLIGASDHLAKMFDTDPLLQTMRKRYTCEFFTLFNMGYQNYAQGEWQVSRRLLERTRIMLGTGMEDGPSAALLRYMEGFNFGAPKSWVGIRELDDKSHEGYALPKRF